MTTRHVSGEVDYPFVPELPSFERAISSGILDVYFVIQGDPSFVTTTSSSSSAPASSSVPDEGCEEPAKTVHLISLTASGADTIFTFHAVEGNKTWVITFTVPNINADTGQVDNDDSTDVRGVFIYNSGNIPTGSSEVNMEVEPTRVQWHTEIVDSITFKNIARCNSVEDSDTLITVHAIADDDPLNVEDGYNTEVSYEDGILSFNAEQGIGKGEAPDLGNSEGCSEEDPTESQVITTINGISPINGNISINVSNRFGKQRTRGRLEIISRRA